MDRARLRQVIEGVDERGAPRVEILKRADETGPKLGVFASSFNPPTVAHFALIEEAARQFSLSEVLALAGKANADKTVYDAPLEDRLMMLMLEAAGAANVSVGLASHAFYVDLLEALGGVYPPEVSLHFVVGFDTFERLLDPQDRYTARYHRRFAGRKEALEFLFDRSRLIVAGRGAARLDHIHALIDKHAPEFAGRILHLDFRDEMAEASATAVRERVRAGLGVSGLVPPAVERYINGRGLYKHYDKS